MQRALERAAYDPVLYGERLPRSSPVIMLTPSHEHAADGDGRGDRGSTTPGTWRRRTTRPGPISAANPPIAVARASTIDHANTPPATPHSDRAPPAGFFAQAGLADAGLGKTAVVPLAADQLHGDHAGSSRLLPNAGGNLPAVPLGATVFSPVVDTFSTTMVTTNAPGAGTPKTYTVANTSGWSANTFWMRDKNTLAWSVVTCLGWTNQPSLRLTNCTGVPATNAGPGVITTGALQARDSGTIGGFIKIDMQDTTGVWRDVTMEILNYGIGAVNLAGANCGDPTPNAILRIQRLRDNGGTCHYAGTTNASVYWPQTLWVARGSAAISRRPTNGNVLRTRRSAA